MFLGCRYHVELKISIDVMAMEPRTMIELVALPIGPIRAKAKQQLISYMLTYIFTK